MEEIDLTELEGMVDQLFYQEDLTFPEQLFIKLQLAQLQRLDRLVGYVERREDNERIAVSYLGPPR